MPLLSVYDVFPPKAHPVYMPHSRTDGDFLSWGPNGWALLSDRWVMQVEPVVLVYPDIEAAISMARYIHAEALRYDAAHPRWGRVLRYALSPHGSGVRMGAVLCAGGPLPPPENQQPPSWFVRTTMPWSIHAGMYPPPRREAPPLDPPSTPPPADVYDHLLDDPV